MDKVTVGDVLEFLAPWLDGKMGTRDSRVLCDMLFRLAAHDSASTSSGTTRPAVSDMEPSTTGSVKESSR
jgi:hypothetical protein